MKILLWRAFSLLFLCSSISILPSLMMFFLIDPSARTRWGLILSGDTITGILWLSERWDPLRSETLFFINGYSLTLSPVLREKLRGFLTLLTIPKSIELDRCPTFWLRMLSKFCGRKLDNWIFRLASRRALKLTYCVGKALNSSLWIHMLVTNLNND